MALLAQIRTEPLAEERRSRARRTLRLESMVGPDGRAVIRNLSETGLLLETSEPLNVGEALAVELPEAGAVQAEVVWARAPFFGCEFARPVGRGSVSAALLRSPIDEPPIQLTTPDDTTWRMPDHVPVSALPPVQWEASAALILFACAAAAFVVALMTLRVG